MWQEQIRTDGQAWAGIKGYATERIADLTSVCVSAGSTDAEIRAAQAGIKELHRLLSIPDQLRNASQARGMTSRITGY